MDKVRKTGKREKTLILDDAAQAALRQMRRICLGLPDTVECLSFGNPTFKAGSKTFAVLDRYKGAYCIWVRCEPGLRQRLLRDDQAYFPAPYDKAKAAICRTLQGTNWREFKPMILASYHLAIV